MNNQLKLKSPVSLVVTFLNELELLPDFFRALSVQTLLPGQLILIDGGSSDGSMAVIKKYQKKLPFPVIVKVKKGNISIGRNYGVSLAQNELIAFTDLGCLPDKNWLAELVGTYQQTKCPVVAGYYYGLAKNDLQRAMLPYSLVMSHRLNPQKFLPASRSMLIEKKLFQLLGGFDVKLAVSEDYDLAKKIEKLEMKLNQKIIAFNQKAQVGWYPRSNLIEFYQMIYRQTQYDLRSGHIRPKVILVLIRYVVVMLMILISAIMIGLITTLFWTIALLFIYSIWSITKNQVVVKNGWYFLPVLQLMSDVAIFLAFLREGPDLIAGRLA